MSIYYNISEFSAKLGVHRHTASKMINNHEYPAFKSGKSFKIPKFYEELKEIEDYALTLPKDKEAITLMLSNNKGGVGKTTTAINLAASLAFFGKKVLLVDGDTQANASKINFLDKSNDFKKNNLTRLLLEIRDYDEDELKQVLSETIVNVESEHFRKGKLDLLPNSIEMDESKEKLFIRPNAENILTKVLAPIKKEYDFIIIDTNPSMDVTWRMAIMASDGIVLAVRPEGYSLDGFEGIFKRTYRLNEDYKEKKGHNIEIVGTVVTAFRKNTINDTMYVEETKEAMKKYPKYNEAELLMPPISFTIKAAEQQTFSGPIMFDEPASNMCLEYLELSKNIMIQAYILEKKRLNK